MDKKTYTQMMAAIDGGEKVSQEAFDQLVEFAAKRKVRKPKPEAVAAEKAPKAEKKAKEPKAPKEKAPKAKCSVTEEQDPAVGKKGCQKDSRAGGMCPAHYSRLVYRTDPERAERVREASRRYAEKRREAKKARAEAEAQTSAA